jgi:hypothetical protein
VAIAIAGLVAPPIREMIAGAGALGAFLEPFREVSIHDEAAVNRRSMRRIMARRMKATAFRA